MYCLEVDSVRLIFNEKLLLSDIYLKLETGKITGLLGLNGQGKSSLLNVIFGSLNCEKSIRINGINQGKKLFKNKGAITYLPQKTFLPKFLSVHSIFYDYNLSFQKFKIKFPELKELYHRKVNELSKGQCRILETYITLMSDSQFVLLDEPFTSMSPIQIENMKEIFLEERSNKGILITEHSYIHVASISDTIYLLKSGRLYEIKDKLNMLDRGMVLW